MMPRVRHSLRSPARIHHGRLAGQLLRPEASSGPHIERHQLPVEYLEQHAIGEPCLNILVFLISVLSPLTD